MLLTGISFSDKFLNHELESCICSVGCVLCGRHVVLAKEGDSGSVHCVLQNQAKTVSLVPGRLMCVAVERRSIAGSKSKMI